MSYKRIISLILVISILCFCSSLVWASGASSALSGFDIVNFFEMLSNNLGLDPGNVSASDFLDAMFSTDDSGCPISPNGCHHWVWDPSSLYLGMLYAGCSYCNQSYKQYLSDQGSSFDNDDDFFNSEEMEDLYADYVDDLPLNGFGFDGFQDSLYFFPYDYYIHEDGDSKSYHNDRRHYDCLISGTTFSFSYTGSDALSNRVLASSNGYYGLPISVFFPVDGYYSGVFSSGGIGYQYSAYISISTSDPGTYISSGLFPCILSTFDRFNVCFSFNLDAFFKCVPSDSGILSTYTASSRPTDLSFNFAYEDNGIYIVYNDITIINEGNSSYYNPVTNVSYDLSHWSYDYSTRTYNVTTTGGDNYSITFGDLSLTIDEGGDVFELNYIAEQAPAVPCNHVFAVSDHQDPTCTLNGFTEYTCSQCGSSYRDTLFALGHEWSFVESVEAEYDENDELVADAYDLYRCIRCGLEKHEAPGSHDDSHDYSVFFSWLQKWLNDFKTWLGDKLDALLGKETEINVDVDNHTVTVINEDGEEEEVDVPDIISRFGWFRDAWAIGTYFVETVGANEQAAYNYAESMRGGAKSGEVATGAPSIKINLSAAQSQFGYDYGGEVEALDLSWYTPYKQTVDNLVSGFLWIVFLWNVFRHAPGIISGSGLTSNHIDDLEQGHKERRRSK